MKNNNNQIFIIVTVIITLLLLCCLIYKNKETFENNFHYLLKKDKETNKTMPLNYNYNNIKSNNIGHGVINKNKMKKMELILYKIVTMINAETDSKYIVGNIDNISINKLDDKSKQYIVDLFLFDKKDNYTLKILIDFTITKENELTDNIIINTITRSNAMKYNYNYMELNNKPLDINNLLDGDKINIQGFNNISLPYSLYKGTKRNATKKINPSDYYNEFLPLLVEQDINHLLLSENKITTQKLVHTKNNICWNCNSGGKQSLTCKCKSLNIFKRDTIPLQPKFNSSIMKNISDKKENSWLFEPTRVEIDHNF